MRAHVLLLLVGLSVSAWAGGEGGVALLRVPAGKEAWVDGTAPFPPTVKVAVLEGDPRGTGPWVVRVKFPAGMVLPLHTHPVDEHSTVISGVAWVGTGASADKASGTRLEAGSYYVNPRGVPHWFIAETEVVLQLANTGPWAVVRVGADAGR
jgi:quercetin dioxygenase-like cupin family protein